MISMLGRVKNSHYYSCYSGREAPSLKMQTVYLIFYFIFVVVVVVVAVGVELSRLRSTALIMSLFCTCKMADACLLCLY